MNLSSETSILEPIGSKKTFFTHVFSTTEEGKAEILNVVQYSLLAIVPIVLLNKSIQRFIPEADDEKSSLEILAEVLIQLIVMFVGIIIIHRIITYVPTYSEFKYESLTLTNVILAFMVLVLSIQTKLGIKVNILVDRLMEIWSGPQERPTKQKARVSQQGAGPMHNPSQGDHLGTSQDVFPPAPMVASKPDAGYDTMMRGNPVNNSPGVMDFGPAPANAALGSSFGSSF